MPIPDLAEQQMASEASRPMTSSICFLDTFDIGSGKIDFIDDRNNFQIAIEG